ncbi:MAG: trimeric autotransporter adhesin [Solirubrobacteraceae bacterium]|nr:trimeric autotransporter adhesin [Solirubrobacteraceae bacterium]
MSHRGLLSSSSRGRMAFAVTIIAFLASTGMARAATIFQDGFESDFSGWTQALTAGNGTAAIQSTHVASGALAAQFTATSTAGSKAYARKTFSTVQQDLTVSGDFKLLTQGATNQNVPFFRLFDPTSSRLLSLYRQNSTKGSIELNVAGARLQTSGSLALNTFARISLHTIVNGTSSTVEVRLNGAQIYSTTSANLGTTGISTFQVGNDTAAQPFSIIVDTIAAQNAAPSDPSPPINTSLPSVTGTPQDGQTLTAGSGVWTGAAPTTYAYQWQRCNNAGSACAPIAAATGPTYAVTSADVAGTLRVAVTATNSVGTATATANATTVVAGLATAPLSTSPPTISGTATSGQALTASPGVWTGTQVISYAYAWQRCTTTGTGCAVIAGATGATYMLGAADGGSTIKVAVTATNSAGTALATSDATAVVQAGAVVAAAGLVALWHMDETSGTVMRDASGRNHNGTLRSGVVLGQPGSTGLAYSFAGSAYVSVPHAADLNPGASTLTLTIRVKTTQHPATPDWDLMRKGLYTTPGGEYKMEEQPSGQASCGFNGSSGYSELTAGPRIDNGVWHTVQCIKTATQIKVVVDGTAYPKSAALGTIANTVDVPIAARPGSEYFQGTLDEASIQVG